MTIKSKRIENELRLRILSGRWAKGEKIPPEEELARSFGVSRNTLRAAMAALRREGWLVSRTVRGTVVGDGPDPIVREGNKRPVYLLCNELFSPLFIGLANDALAFFEPRREYDFRLKVTGNDPAREAELVQRLGADPAARFILVSLWSDRTRQMICTEPERFVILGPTPEIGSIVSQCYPDRYLGGKLLMRHLFELGHTRIAYCGPFADETRFLAWRDAFVEAGLPIRREYLMPVSDKTTPGELYELFRRQFESNELPSPTAFFCASAYFAKSLIHFALGIGKPVPEKLSVVSMDGYRFREPDELGRDITTACPPRFRLLETALACLNGMRRGVITIPCELVPGTTTAQSPE